MKTIALKTKNKLLGSDYNLSGLHADLLSALSVALLALPQSMAYALIVGLPLHSGILAAILGTILTSLFGHSKHLISGPTNATALLIQAGTSHILYRHFHEVPEAFKEVLILQIISQLVLFIGLIQLIISLLKLGGFTQFISRSVMMGYILGVSLSIWVGQVFTLLSIQTPPQQSSLFQLIPYLFKKITFINPYSTLLGVFCFLILVLFKKVNPRLPRSFLTLLFGAFLAYLSKTFFSFGDSIETVSAPHFNIPSLFHTHFFYLNKPILQDFLFISLAIALLSIFEVNSISRLISAKSGQSIKSNRDILSVGISNFVSSFFLGTLPSSGSPSRSIFNYSNGSQSQLAGIFTGLFVLLILGVFYPLIQFVPVAALSALLLMIAYEIIDLKLLKTCLKATKRDALVLIVTCLSCLFFQLDVALFIGIALSLILYLRLAAKTNILEYVFTEEGHFKPVEKNKERSEKRIRILNMEGNLFFGSIDGMQKKLNRILLDKEVQILILRLKNVPYLDASICYFLETLVNDLTKQGKRLYLCEMHQSTMTVVHETPLMHKLGQDYLYERDYSSPISATQKAFAHALKELNASQKIHP